MALKDGYILSSDVISINGILSLAQRGILNHAYNATARQFVLDSLGQETSFLVPKTAQRGSIKDTPMGESVESIAKNGKNPPYALLTYRFKDPRESVPGYSKKIFTVEAHGYLYGHAKTSYPTLKSGGGSNTLGSMFTMDVSGKAYNEAVYKMQSKIASRAQTLVSLAEGKQSVNMLASTATTVFQALRAVRRGRFSQAASILGLKKAPNGLSRKKQFSQNWLAYRYGWTPLYGDILGHATAIYDVLHKPMIFRCQGKGQEVAKPTNPSPLPTVNKYLSGSLSAAMMAGQDTRYTYSLPLTVRRERLHSQKDVKVGCIFEIQDASAFNAEAFGVSNPLMVAWELVPFSFVADWFISIGDWLNQLTAYRGLKMLTGFVKVETKDYFRDHISKVPETNPSYQTLVEYTVSNDTFDMCHHRESRQRIYTLPYSSIQTTSLLDAFSDKLGMKRLTDVFSLIVGMTDPSRNRKMLRI